MTEVRAPRGSSRPGRRHLARRRAGELDPPTRIVGMTPERLLVVFMVLLVLPINFTLAGLQLTAYSSLLIVSVIPAFFYFIRLKDYSRVVPLDVFMALNVLWIGIAIYHAHGASRLVFILNQSLTLFGAYFLGRVLVRSAEDYRRLMTCMLWIMVGLLPFAFIEFAFHLSLVDLILREPAFGGGPAGFRLGFRRTTTVFPHPILFGVFCSIFVANFFYVFRSGRLWKTLLAVGMTFMALSTGPLLAMLVQFVLIGWQQVLRILPSRWFLLALTCGGALGILQLGYPGGLVAFVIETFAYNEQTGWVRTEILHWGSLSVRHHPFFGIGLNEWVGPWWRKQSVDNFWLVVALRYGLPALIFMWAGLALHEVQIMLRRDLSEDASNYRKGYLMAMAGLFIVLGTVHIWGAISVFVMFYFGAGAWIYARPAAETVQRERLRAAEVRQARHVPVDGTPTSPRRVRAGAKPKTEIGLKA